jgi:hypothetical protein
MDARRIRPSAGCTQSDKLHHSTAAQRRLNSFAMRAAQLQL